VERLHPRISVGKTNVPVLFVDTFMWRRLLTDCQDEAGLLRECCEDRALIVAFNNALEGELTQRNLLTDVRALCGDALLSLPLVRVAAKQAIHALICYLEKRRDVQLNWDLMISKPVGLDSLTLGLRGRIASIVDELNRARAGSQHGVKPLIAILADIKRSLWKHSLDAYSKVILPCYLDAKYERFFYTDYFSDLPFLVIKAYFLADILVQREIKIQDIIDIHCIAEIVPYSTLFILDADQHNRLCKLRRQYQFLFTKIENTCRVSSVLKSAASEPRSTLRSFLGYVRSEK